MKNFISYIFFLMVEMITPTNIACYNANFTGKLQKLKKSSFDTSPEIQKGPKGNRKIGFLFARIK